MTKQVRDNAFIARQEAAKNAINQSDRERHKSNSKRDAFFETVYDQAERDAALVPWADLDAKQQLKDWLRDNPGRGRRG
ncbi:MAG: class I SAM-dependent methyltransferase, partial [Pseudomonadota bacterium]